MNNEQIQVNQDEVSGKPVVTASGHRFVEVIVAIQKYHVAMGRPRKEGIQPTFEEQLEHHRLNVLALVAEAIETLDSAPWKPWKNYKEEEVSRPHMAEELADIVFFITALMTNWDIQPYQLEQAILQKVEENYRRIQVGYSKVKE